MNTVTHREMRNQSGAILREVAAGETVRVTNNGQVAALIVPPSTDTVTGLIERGQARAAKLPLSSLQTIQRRSSSLGSAEIIADSRSRW